MIHNAKRKNVEGNGENGKVRGHIFKEINFLLDRASVYRVISIINVVFRVISIFIMEEHQESLP